jgi:hypothetical protein
LVRTDRKGWFGMNASASHARSASFSAARRLISRSRLVACWAAACVAWATVGTLVLAPAQALAADKARMAVTLAQQAAKTFLSPVILPARLTCTWQRGARTPSRNSCLERRGRPTWVR